MGMQSVSVVQMGLKRDCHQVILSTAASKFDCCGLEGRLMTGIAKGYSDRLELLFWLWSLSFGTMGLDQSKEESKNE